MFVSSLHIEILDSHVFLRASTDDENNGMAFQLTPEQAAELANKLIVSAETAARHRDHQFQN